MFASQRTRVLRLSNIVNSIVLNVLLSTQLLRVTHTQTHTHHFNGHFPSKPGSTESPLVALTGRWGCHNVLQPVAQPVMSTTVAKGFRCKVFTGRMPFLSPNQQHKSTEWRDRLTDRHTRSPTTITSTDAAAAAFASSLTLQYTHSTFYLAKFDWLCGICSGVDCNGDSQRCMPHVWRILCSLHISAAAGNSVFISSI